jgi:hypothetical protein
MFGISHLDIMPLIYGGMIFLGLWSMWRKLVKLRLIGFAIELGVFLLVFSLHGGSVSGGFAATIAALIAGMVFQPKLTLKGRKRRL